MCPQETEVPSGPKPRKVKAYMHLAAIRWLLRSSRRGGCMVNGLYSQSLRGRKDAQVFPVLPIWDVMKENANLKPS